MDPSLLISPEDILLSGTVAVSFKNLVEPNGYHYGNSDGDEVTGNHSECPLTKCPITHCPLYIWSPVCGTVCNSIKMCATL